VTDEQKEDGSILDGKPKRDGVLIWILILVAAVWLAMHDRFRDTSQPASVPDELAKLLALQCEERSICAEYAEVRQECATAGSYRNCMSIKLSHGWPWASDGCNPDGSVIGAGPDAPGRLQCTVSDASLWLGRSTHWLR